MNGKEVIRILLADDDPDDQLLFREALEGIKIRTQVNTVENGIELMKLLHHHENILPHILFMDLHMPMKSGMDCLQEIRRNPAFQDVAVVIYSTSSMDRDIEESFVRGANVFLQKPNDFPSLKKALGEIITINWQYQTCGLNRDNFLLCL
jgi:CheY-like chemotaxis protein